MAVEVTLEGVFPNKMDFAVGEQVEFHGHVYVDGVARADEGVAISIRLGATWKEITYAMSDSLGMYYAYWTPTHDLDGYSLPCHVWYFIARSVRTETTTPSRTIPLHIYSTDPAECIEVRIRELSVPSKVGQNLEFVVSGYLEYWDGYGWVGMKEMRLVHLFYAPTDKTGIPPVELGWKLLAEKKGRESSCGLKPLAH